MIRLQEAGKNAPEGAVYVVDEQMRRSAMGKAGWRNCNLRTQFQRIIKRAGLKPWPRLFHNLRASRETELAAEHSLHVVTAWMGNTPRIAAKHYLMVTDADFAKALQKAVHETPKALQKAVQQGEEPSCTESQETTQPLENQEVVPLSVIQCRNTSGEDRTLGNRFDSPIDAPAVDAHLGA